MLKIYGINNCDTCKRCRKWLESNGYEYAFHDFRSDGLDRELLDRLAEKIGWENMLNRRGASWRQLRDSDRANLNEDQAKRLMLKHPTLIKRPVIEHDDRCTTGFSTDYFASGT